MRNSPFTFTSLRVLVSVGALLTFVTCDDPPTVPFKDAGSAWEAGDLAGTYAGAVQDPGDALSDAGEAVLVIEETAEGIAGTMVLVAEFGEGTEAISLSFATAYIGVVTHEFQPHVTLAVEHPDCEGVTEFTGTYSPSDSSLNLGARYVHKDADGCETIATVDLSISVRKTAG